MATRVMYFINVGLAVLSLIEIAALLLLYKKTTFAYVAGLASAFIYMFGFIAFIVQLVMFPLGHKYTPQAVYAAMAIMSSGFIVCGIYCIMLCRRSKKAFCIITGIFQLVPPVGTILLMILCKVARRDTRAQELVFTGYSFTLAALAEFSAKYAPDFIDAAETANFEPLSKSGVQAHLKKLKKQTKTPEGCFKYGEAVAHYTPQNMHESYNYISRAAKGDYPPALFNLGYFHDYGIYVKKDIKKAREYYKRAADLGDADAGLRLAIADLSTGNAAGGLAEIKRRAEKDNVAKFDYALCLERGVGEPCDMLRAVDLYTECAKSGLLSAQRRLFGLLADMITSGKTDDGIYGKIVGAGFLGEFGLMVSGADSIANKQTPEASEIFICAVKKRGKWEGDARLFIGTLYVDCGKLDADRRNGAAYVKSALNLTPVASRVYSLLPKEIKEDKAPDKPKQAKPAEKKA